MNRKAVSRFIVACAPLLFGACGTTPAAHLYTLAAHPPAGEATSLAVQPTKVVLIQAIELPKYLDRSQIARYGTDYELRVEEYERWAEPVKDMTQRVLVENLTDRLPSRRVVAGTIADDLHADTTIRIECSRFDAAPDGTVYLNARWLVRPLDGPERWGASQIRVPTPGGDAPALVAGMSTALAMLADRIAPDLNSR
jgi:uncharacterized lipoprotein YmbA